MMFSALPRSLPTLHTANLGSKDNCGGLNFSHIQCGRLVSCRWLQLLRGPPLARRGLQAPMRETTTSGTVP